MRAKRCHQWEVGRKWTFRWLALVQQISNREDIQPASTFRAEANGPSRTLGLELRELFGLEGAVQIVL